MRKVGVFETVSLDGYFTDASNDYRWAHQGANDPELMEFTKGNALLSADPATEIARMKQTPGPDLTVLGSGTIVAQLTAAGLVDEVQLMVAPVMLGSGRSLFAGVSGKPWWTLSRSKTFRNGRVFLAYGKTD